MTQLKSMLKKKKKTSTHIQHSNNLLFLDMKKKVTENVSQYIQNITKIYYKLACLYLNLVIILLKKKIG